MTNIFARRPKHRDGDVDADYHHRTSVAAGLVTCLIYSILIIHFWHREVKVENAGLLSSRPSARPRGMAHALRSTPA